MKWRVIMRFSFEADQGSALRNSIAPLLEKCGLHNTGTGIWETTAGQPLEIALQLQDVLITLANITQDHPGDKSVNLDHIWIYIDKGPRTVKDKFELDLSAVAAAPDSLTKE